MIKLDADAVTRLAGALGDAFYLLDSNLFIKNYSDMLRAFREVYPDTHIAYSYKTNYIPKLCKIIDRLGGFAEVVSSMEYELAKTLGVIGENIFFNGPYKNFDALQIAISDNANINLDSFEELDAILQISETLQRPVRIGLRCNFDIGIGAVSRFGFDVKGDAFRHALHIIDGSPYLQLTGLHCHFPCRDLVSFSARAEGMMAVLDSHRFNDLEYVSFGGGYFGRLEPEFAESLGIVPPSYSDYAQIVAGAMRDYARRCKAVKLIIEPGSALVADTMCLAARVVSIKNVRGRNIATLAGSSYNINPSVKSVKRPVQIINHRVGIGEEKEWDIVGYTCIEDDCLYKAYSGRVEVNDFAIFYNVGSYSLVFKPPFIQPNIAVADIASGSDNIELVRRKEEFKDIFKTFVM